VTRRNRKEIGPAALAPPGGWLSWVVLAVVMALGVGLRLYDLPADPPLGMTWSHSLYTDGARIVEGARTRILWGQWDMDPEGPATVFYPLSSLLAWTVFSVFGLGLWQANLTGVIPGLISLLLVVWLGLRKSWWVGAFSGFLVGLNFYLVAYNRLPVTESLMIALMLAVPALLFREPLRVWHLVLAGGVLGAAGLFVKFHALLLLPVSVVWLLLFVQEPGEPRRAGKSVGAFLTGVGLSAVLWCLVILVPHPRVVGGFLEHNLISHYGEGTPEGVLSAAWLGQRVTALVGLGTNVSFFGRMPSVGLVALVVALSFASRWRTRVGRAYRVESFFGLWLLGGIVALSLLDYRPLRYHLQLIPSAALLASVGLARLLVPEVPSDLGGGRGRSAWVFIFALFIAYQVLIELPVYMARHMAASAALLSGFGVEPRGFFDGLFGFVSSSGSVFAVSAVAAAVTTVLVARIERRRPAGREAAPLYARVGLVAALLVFGVLVDGDLHRGAWTGARHSLRDTSRDLGVIVGPGGFLVGTTATTLTLENRLQSLPSYGRIVRLEKPELLEAYPITHVLLRGGVLSEFLTRHFEGMSDRTVFVRRYVIGPAESGLYRVEGWPGAESYRPTAFERGMALVGEERWKDAAAEFRAFLDAHPQNAAATQRLGLCLERGGEQEAALEMMERAVALAPGDLAILCDLGAAYARAGRLPQALDAWRRVLVLNPGDARAAGYMETLRRTLQGGASEAGRTGHE